MIIDNSIYRMLVKIHEKNTNKWKIWMNKITLYCILHVAEKWDKYIQSLARNIYEEYSKSKVRIVKHCESWKHKATADIQYFL